MTTFTGDYCAQGDVNLFRVTDIPKALAALPSAAEYVLAHSETGHSHVIDGNAVRVYKQDEFISYLEVKKPATVQHLRSFDTHSPITLPPGKYRVTRQREYVPEGFRLAAD